MACKGCHSRLELQPGISGYCDPCYLATRIEKLVFTRYPPCKARELTHFLAKTLGILEKDTEDFESDRTVGLVDPKGYLVEASKEAKDRAPGAYEAGIHTGKKHPESSAASTKKEQESNEDEVKEGVSSRRRRRRGDRERSRSQSRRREKKKERGKGTEKVKERSRSRWRERKKKQEEASPIEAEEVGTEPEPSPEKASQEEEIEQEENKEELEKELQTDDLGPNAEVAPLESHFPGDRERHQGHRQAIEDDHKREAKSGRVSNTSFGGRPWDTATEDVAKAKGRGNAHHGEEGARGERTLEWDPAV